MQNNFTIGILKVSVNVIHLKLPRKSFITKKGAV